MFVCMRMRYLIVLSLAVLFDACRESHKSAHLETNTGSDYGYFIDTKGYTCRTYPGMHPPPPPPEHLHLFDSVYARSEYQRYMVYASLTDLRAPVLVRGTEYYVFQFKAWDNVYGDWVNSKEVRLVHPFPQECYFYLELQTDTENAMFHIGYDADGKFYSFYDVYVDDKEYEKEMKIDTARARSYVRGNVYVKYKRQVLDSK